MSTRSSDRHIARRASSHRAASTVGAALVLMSFAAAGAHADVGDTVDGRASGGGARPAGKVLELDVTGRGGTAGDATAVSLNVTATQPAGAGFATVYPCGTARPDASTINFAAGTTIANAVTSRVGSNGAVCIYTQQETHLVVDVNGYYVATNNPTSDYRPLTPARLLDTRRGQSTIDGRGSGGGVRPAGKVLELDVTGRGGTAGDATAVSLNVTATQPAGAGFATVYPCGTARPDASTINFAAGTTIANAVTSRVGSNGAVCIYTQQETHLVVDVNGYYVATNNPTSEYRPLTPARLLDTRRGQSTIDGRGSGGGVRPAGKVLELDVTGRGGTAGDATAVSLNVTATQPAGAGFATVYPCGTARPDASTINFAAGTTIANAVTSRVGSNGAVCIYTQQETHLVVDVNGYYVATNNPTSEYRPLTPARLLDTRRGQSTIDGRGSGGGVRPAGKVLELDVTGRGGTAGDATAVSLNVTATQPAGAGFATVYPCGTARPDASTINFAAGTTIANAVTSRVGSNGAVCIYTQQETHLVVDVNGYYTATNNPTSEYRPLTPARLLDTRTNEPPAPPVVDKVTQSLSLLNALRAANGVGPVVLDAAMTASAVAWSQEMSRTGFRHSSVGFAENIAWHSSTSLTPIVAATTLHDMWVNSPGHYANMLDPRWTRVGIGIELTPSGWYGTHMFA